jgi:hypothetical protein
MAESTAVVSATFSDAMTESALMPPAQ